MIIKKGKDYKGKSKSKGKGKGKESKGKGNGEAHQAEGSETQPSVEQGQRQETSQNQYQQQNYEGDWSEDYWWGYATTDQQGWGQDNVWSSHLASPYGGQDNGWAPKSCYGDSSHFYSPLAQSHTECFLSRMESWNTIDVRKNPLYVILDLGAPSRWDPGQP